ncbi:MAG: tetratricopeptide repeat protein [Gammaproteobacteria bacterium]
MTSTKYYRMMEKLHRPDNAKPGGTAQDDASHSRRLSGGYWLGGALVAVLVLVFLMQGGLPPSDSQELAWLNRLATANNPDAQLQLGLAYREGRYGLAPDARAGHYWLEKAARNGEEYAVDLLAGRPTTEAGADEAARTPVSSRLDTIATHIKSPMLVTISAFWKILGLGLTGSQSPDALQQRAQSGDPAAEFQLGMRYRDGAWSVNRDPDKASYWLKRAADAGNPLAVKALAEDENISK